MKISKFTPSYNPISLAKYLVTICLILLVGKYLLKDALPLLGFDKNILGSYWNYRWPLFGHIIGGMIALTIGPFQFWNWFRNKYMTAHRWLGKTYLIAILIGTISGSYLAWTTAYQLSFSFAFGMQMLALAWITSSAMAYISIIKKRIIQHKEWMIRSYVITFAFANFRWLADLQILRDLMNTTSDRVTTITWLCWTIPLFITEIILGWRRK